MVSLASYGEQGMSKGSIIFELIRFAKLAPKTTIKRIKKASLYHYFKVLEVRKHITF